jgi:tetratricopeptide (TPR) repeat protein
MNGEQGMTKVTLWFLLFPIIAVFLSNCVNEPDDVVVLPPTDLYHVKITEAWIQFESGLYSDAIAAFREASEIDPLDSYAYLGLGWCYAMIDQMEDSLSDFGSAIMKDPASPDGYAAKAFVYLAQNEYEAAIAAADQAISLGGERYVFSQIPEVRTRNLRLLMAECYYAMGKYANAQAQIDILKPDNNLNQNSRTYKQDLILEIESLNPDEPVLGFSICDLRLQNS